MISCRTTLLAVIAATGSVAAAQPVIYDFSGTLGDHFAPFIDDAEVISSQTGGVLRFDTGDAVTTLDPVDAYAHTTFAPSYTESWTASIDFELPLVYDSNFVPLTTITQEISLGIAAIFTAGDTTFNLVGSNFEVFNPGSNFGPLERQYWSDSIIDDVTGAENWLPTPGVSTGTLTLTFDAATKVITTSNGNGDVILSVDIDAPGSNWNMTDTDTFTIGIFAGTDKRAILTSTPITLDNFSGEIIVPDVTYDFSGTLFDNFLPINDALPIISQQAVGVLRFDTNDANSGGDFFDIYAHSTFAPRFDESWTATVEFDLPLVYDSNYAPSTVTEQGVGLGIGALFTDGLTFFNGFAINLEVWSDGTIIPNPRRQYYTSTFINGIDFPEAEVPAPGVTTGSLTLTFDATTKVMTATDSNGQTLLSSDLDAPGTTLGMTASDTFAVGIFGGATNRTIFTASPLTLDNFSARITSAGPVDPVCTADLNGDGILDSGDIQTFIGFFLGGDLAADLNGDSILDSGDIQTFVQLFLAGC